MALKPNDIVMLEYTFILDTVEGFQHLWEFEKALRQFFSERGMNCDPIKPMGGSPDRRVMYITKKIEAIEVGPQKQPVGRPQTLKGKIKELSDRKYRKAAVEFMKGKK